MIERESSAGPRIGEKGFINKLEFGSVHEG
jgi:hypothetical protein